jgi:hypothetical protein
MVKNYLDKKAKSRVKVTDSPSGKVLAEKQRDDDDKVIWVDVATVTPDVLQTQIDLLTNQETSLKADLVKIRAAITNLQDIKTDLFPGVK